MRASFDACSPYSVLCFVSFSHHVYFDCFVLPPWIGPDSPLCTIVGPPRRRFRAQLSSCDTAATCCSTASEPSTLPTPCAMRRRQGSGAVKVVHRRKFTRVREASLPETHMAQVISVAASRSLTRSVPRALLLYERWDVLLSQTTGIMRRCTFCTPRL